MKGGRTGKSRQETGSARKEEAVFWKASRRACRSNSSPRELEPQARRRLGAEPRSAHTSRATPENAGDRVSPCFLSGAQGSAGPLAGEGSRTETLWNSYAKKRPRLHGAAPGAPAVLRPGAGIQARRLARLPRVARCSRAGSCTPRCAHRRVTRGGSAGGGGRLPQTQV